VALASKGAVPAVGWGWQVMLEPPPPAGQGPLLPLALLGQGLPGTRFTLLATVVRDRPRPLQRQPSVLLRAQRPQAAGGRASETQPPLAQSCSRSGCWGPAGSTAAAGALSGEGDGSGWCYLPGTKRRHRLLK